MKRGVGDTSEGYGCDDVAIVITPFIAPSHIRRRPLT